MQQDPRNALGLPMVATSRRDHTGGPSRLESERAGGPGDRLGAAFRDLNDVRAKLRNFKHIAEGGSPRLATDMGKGGE
jgi:hypothetical protein